MPSDKPKKITKKQKIYFVYFIIFSVLIIIIFSFIILGTFWDYWAKIRRMENFYKNRLIKFSQTTPDINNADPIKGEINAAVTVYEYSDFLCTACKNLQPDLNALAKLYGNKIRYVFKGIAFTVHPQSRPALNAAYCAEEQNQFWQYKPLLFQDPQTLTRQKYLEYANQLNLNLESFNTCLDSNKYTLIINQNMTEALSLQITSTPALFINDQKMEGFLNYNSIKKVIDLKLLSP